MYKYIKQSKLFGIKENFLTEELFCIKIHFFMFLKNVPEHGYECSKFGAGCNS